MVGCPTIQTAPYMNPGPLTRALLIFAAYMGLAACEKDPNDRVLELSERARLTSVSTEEPSTSSPAAAESPKRPEDALFQLKQDQRLVLFCAGDLRDPVQATELGILETAVPALGKGLILKHLDASGDASLQLRHLQTATKAKPAVLIIHPLEERLTSALLQDLRAAGTIVLGTDGRLPAEACNQCAFVDQKKLGGLAGEVVIAALKRKAQEEGRTQITGRVVQITSLDEAPSAREQSIGLMQALQSETGIVLVHDAPGEWTSEGAGMRVTEALRLQGQFDAVIVQSDAMALGVSEALTAAGKREEVLIVSVGGLRQPDGGVDLLRRAVIDALILHPLPMEKLYPALRDLASKPDFHPPPLRDELAPVIVTPKNLNDALRR